MCVPCVFFCFCLAEQVTGAFKFEESKKKKKRTTFSCWKHKKDRFGAMIWTSTSTQKKLGVFFYFRKLLLPWWTWSTIEYRILYLFSGVTRHPSCHHSAGRQLFIFSIHKSVCLTMTLFALRSLRGRRSAIRAFSIFFYFFVYHDGGVCVLVCLFVAVLAVYLIFVCMQFIK